MSNPGDRGEGFPERDALARLDVLVGEAVEEIRRLREQLEKSESRRSEAVELLRRFTEEEEDPSRLLTRLRTLDRDNTALHQRLEQGREAVERLLARIRFLEEQG